MNDKKSSIENFLTSLINGKFEFKTISPFPSLEENFENEHSIFFQNLNDLITQNIYKKTPLTKIELLKLGEDGCLSMLIPKEYNGMGLSLVNYNKVISFIASLDISTAISVAAHQSIGAPQPLILFGNAKQKKQYLPSLSKETISAFALTESKAGSDPANMKTTVTTSPNKMSYILNGEKLWITNAPIADVFVVIAQKNSDNSQKKEYSAFIVLSSTPGVSINQNCEFMGIERVSNGLIKFENVYIPTENIIGEEGQGLKIALTVLNTGRLSIGAIACGASKTAIKKAKLWAEKRIQAGKQIKDHQIIKSKLNTMSAKLLAMESTLWLSTSIADKSENYRLEAAITKYFCSESAWSIADECLQIHGGRGYETYRSLSQREITTYTPEKTLRDLRILRIIEGTSEIMEQFIYKEITSRINSQSIDILKQDEHKPQNNKYLNFIENYTTLFHKMLLKQKINNKLSIYDNQVLNAYYTKIFCYLYSMAATLSYTNYLNDSSENQESIKPLAHLYCETTMIEIDLLIKKINLKLDQIILNTPSENIEVILNSFDKTAFKNNL